MNWLLTPYLILLEGRLGLSIRSLALAIIPSYRRATSRGCHTRHRADLCNFVCLCSWCERRNYSPLSKVEVPAYACLKKLQLKNMPSCRDHCITWRGEKKKTIPVLTHAWKHNPHLEKNITETYRESSILDLVFLFIEYNWQSHIWNI